VALSARNATMCQAQVGTILRSKLASGYTLDNSLDVNPNGRFCLQRIDGMGSLS
jgi:hypothetical protein